MTDGNDGPGLTPEEFAQVKVDLERFLSPDEVYRRELIHSIRPEWQQLGLGLFALVEAACVALGGEPSWAPAEPFDASYPDDRVLFTESSPAAADRDANFHPTVNPDNGRVIAAVKSQVSSTLDHLIGLAVLLSATGPIRPTFAAARAVLLAGTRTTWLAAADLDPSARVTRSVNLELEKIADAHSDLRDDTGELAESQRTELENRERQVLAAGDRDGLSRRGNGKWFQPGSSSGDTLTEAAAPGLGRTTWRMLSSSAHGMDRGPYASLSLNQIFESADQRTRRAYAAGGIYPVVILAFSGLESAANYLGGDVKHLNDVLQPLHAMWERGTMDSSGEKENARIVDDYLNDPTVE